MTSLSRVAAPLALHLAPVVFGLPALLLAALGCDVAAEPASKTDSGARAAMDALPPPTDAVPDVPPEAARAGERAVTADFLNGTLSIVDLDALREGATRADALVGTVDLSRYTPGPMSLGITPDGKTAVVSVSGGFLRLFTTVPEGEGTLVFVDLEKREVVGDLYVGDSPMGIVFSPDSKRAFVGLFGETYFAVVDLETRTFQPVQTGAAYNEELAIDDGGDVGILTYGPAGDVKTFALADPAGSLGGTMGLTGDAAGVAFFPGTKTAYLMQAPTSLTGQVGGHDLIDVTDPLAPVASDGERRQAHPGTYPVTAVPSRGSVVFPWTDAGQVFVVEMALVDGRAEEVQRILVGPAERIAYGVTAAPDSRVFIATPGERYVGVAELETGNGFTVPWEMDASGPTEIKWIP